MIINHYDIDQGGRYNECDLLLFQLFSSAFWPLYLYTLRSNSATSSRQPWPSSASWAVPFWESSPWGFSCLRATSMWANPCLHHHTRLLHCKLLCSKRQNRVFRFESHWSIWLLIHRGLLRDSSFRCVSLSGSGSATSPSNLRLWLPPSPSMAVRPGWTPLNHLCT